MKTSVTQVGGTGEFYDRSAFAGVTTARFGTSGRNLPRGPRIINVDFGLFRNIKLTERVNLQFRAEAFNLSNTPHFNNPSANVNASDSMRITSALDDQRSMRFGLRVRFQGGMAWQQTKQSQKHEGREGEPFPAIVAF